MSTSGAARLKSWLRRSLKLVKESDSRIGNESSERLEELINPVDNYYRHRLTTNLPVFYRFALQTRSLAVRDIFAKAASQNVWDVGDLLAVLGNQDPADLGETERRSLRECFDSSVLLTLADLLANTARDDLDSHAAVKIYTFVYQVFGKDPFNEQHILQYVEALNEIQLYEDSERLASEFQINEIAPLQTELLQLQQTRNSILKDREWLDALNDLYRSLGMTKLRLLSDESLPLLDRLAAEATIVVEGPKVSVIMPSHAPGPGIWAAIRGLLEQTWQNLEIIVVDDASGVEYLSIFDEIEKLDSRIQVVRQDHNLGAYVARNTGLEIATGAFITTHDDDDWSHPDKIAAQVQVLLENPSVVATTSAHIRTTSDMTLRRLNIQAKFLQMNYSSLMFRRFVTEEIGKWDTVNRGGDSEFYMRLTEYYGADRIVDLCDKPLSFSRVWQGSLTSGEMSRGYFAYSRLLYRWAFRQWHWEMGKRGQKAIMEANSSRPYAIPTTFEAGKRNENLGQFDVVYVTDFFRQAKFVTRVLNEIETLCAAGLRVGYIHLNSPQTSRPAGFQPRLFELQYEGKLLQISLDDIAETTVMIVYDASIGMFVDELNPSIRSHRAVVVHNELSSLFGANKRSPILWEQALWNLDSAFGTVFKVVGATREDQEQIRLSVPHARVLEDESIWSLHLQDDFNAPTPPSQRPIVGFHSYGNLYRWPKSAEDFRSVYSSPEYETKLYGQTRDIEEKFGLQVLDGIEVISMDQMSESDFLSTIDFWVYWPHPRLRDQVWEPVLRAMQSGKVVLLPSHLESVYGDGAIYVDKQHLSRRIEELVARPDLYKLQAQRGQRLVEEAFTSERYLQRITKLLQ